MLSTYVAIAQAIHTAVPDLRWFDLDKNQLDDPTAFNSLILPACLIGQADIVWKQLGANTLLGEGTITLKTVLRLPAQTHLLDPLWMYARRSGCFPTLFQHKRSLQRNKNTVTRRR